MSLHLGTHMTPDFKCGNFKSDAENGITPEIRERMNKDRAQAEGGDPAAGLMRFGLQETRRIQTLLEIQEKLQRALQECRDALEEAASCDTMRLPTRQELEEKCELSSAQARDVREYIRQLRTDANRSTSTSSLARTGSVTGRVYCSEDEVCALNTLLVEKNAVLEADNARLREALKKARPFVKICNGRYSVDLVNDINAILAAEPKAR